MLNAAMLNADMFNAATERNFPCQSNPVIAASREQWGSASIRGI